MQNGTVRKILLIAAGSVFLISSIMVSKYHLELRTSEAYTENMVQMVVAYADAPAQETEEKTAAEASDFAYSQASQETIIKPSAVASKHTANNESSDEVSENAEEDPFSGPAADIPMHAVRDILGEAAGDISSPAAEEIACKEKRVAPIQVDFEALRAKNKDVVAWIYCPETPINYPVVQADDNERYMHRRLDGSRSYPGTLFMDYRNANDFSDWNSVIYGHNMRNGSMFGTLQHYKNKQYFETHSEIYLLTPESNYAIDVLAGFVTQGNAELYNSLEADDGEKDLLLKEWLKAADIALENTPAPDVHLITLSTCSYEYKNARYVLIGTLEELSN